VYISKYFLGLNNRKNIVIVNINFLYTFTLNLCFTIPKESNGKIIPLSHLLHLSEDM